jgi:hypothetical protein
LIICSANQHKWNKFNANKFKAGLIWVLSRLFCTIAGENNWLQLIGGDLIEFASLTFLSFSDKLSL